MSAFQGTVASWAVHTGPIVVDAVKGEAPNRTGALKGSIRAAQKGRLDNVWIEVTSALPYAVMMRDGTKAHIITPRNASVLHWLDSSGNDVFRMSVNHPGTKANDYPGRAWGRVGRKAVTDLKLRLGRAAMQQMKDKASSAVGSAGSVGARL